MIISISQAIFCCSAVLRSPFTVAKLSTSPNPGFIFLQLEFCPVCVNSRQLIVVHGSYYVRSCWLYLKLAVKLNASQCLKHLKPQHNLFDQDYLARIVPTRGCVDLFDAEAIHLSTTDLRHPSPRKPFWSSARTGRTREAPEKWCAMRTCQPWLAWTFQLEKYGKKAPVNYCKCIVLWVMWGIFRCQLNEFFRNVMPCINVSPSILWWLQYLQLDVSLLANWLNLSLILTIRVNYSGLLR